MLRFRTFTVAAAIALVAAASEATTIIPLSDDALIERAPIIAEISVESQLPTVHDRPRTDWMVAIDRVLKGRIDSGRIVLGIPGGEAPNGLSLRIYGAPRFVPGSTALVFLRQRSDGSYALTDFPQGAFQAVSSRIRRLAIRDYSEVEVIEGGRVGRREPLRDFDRFADWIADRTAGSTRLPDYVVEPRAAELSTISSHYTLFEDGGFNLRWFDFDSGKSVSWRSSTIGMPGLTGGGATELQRGLAAWNNEPTTPLRLVYSGTSSAKGGLTTFDNLNVVLWTDPNDEIDGTFDCNSGGTVAIGGPWYDASSKGIFNGKSFIKILGGDVIFANGLECKMSESPNYSKLIEAIAAHEIGHTLGLDHSSEKANESNPVLKQALMYFRAHDDGSGARLNSDDIAGLQFLYRKSTGGGGGGGGTTTSGCPAGTPANTLCLVKGRFKVTATWENQYNSTNGDALPIPNSDLSGFFYFTDKTNVELIVKILASSTNTQVFYSQLTDLHFVLNVTDTLTGRTKIYRNTAGNCGGLDESFDSGSAASSVAALDILAGNATSGCTPDARTLCLLDNRFAVTVDWRNQYDGSSGVGAPKPISRFTGGFSFTGPANLELFIKTLQFPDNLLVLYGALSNLEYTIHVTDTSSGAKKDYHNPAGNFCGGLDNHAF